MRQLLDCHILYHRHHLLIERFARKIWIGCDEIFALKILLRVPRKILEATAVCFCFNFVVE